MGKYLRVSFAAVLLGLTLPATVSAQTAKKTEATQARRVRGQVLSSPSLPHIRIRFDPAFKYVGSQKFILYDRAQVEQHFFVDADTQHHIQRMYMVQFEGYLPDVDAAYDYPVTKTVNLGGQTYLVNVENISDVAAALKQNPRSDVARAATFLEGRGYRIGESITYLRLVRLVDEVKRHEFLLVYVEDAGAGASSGKDSTMQEFSSRALRGFTILK